MSPPNQPPAPNPPGDSAHAPRDGYGSGYGYGYGYGSGYGYSAQRYAEFARTWHALLEKWWVIALCTGGLLAVGLLYIKRSPVLYSATATIQAEQDQPDLLKMDVIQTRDINAVDYLQTIAQTVTSRPLLARVADTNTLWTDARFITRTNADSPGAFDRDRLLNRLERMVQAKLRRGTRLIDITVKHGVPELTAQIANSIVDTYIAARAERADTTIGAANENLTREADRLRKKLEESENALQAYKEQHNASSLDDRQNTVVAKLNELSTRATEAKSLRIQTETEYGQALLLGTNVEALLVVPAVAGDNTVGGLKLSLAKAENDLAALRQRYKEKHPKHILAVTQCTELRRALNGAVLDAVETLKASLDNARAAEQALHQAMEAQETAALELSKLSIEYTVLKREVESDRTLYDAVLKGMKQATVSQAMERTGIVRMVMPAYLPEHPVAPRKSAILAMSGLGGLFLGVLLVMGLRVTDTSLKTVDEAEATLGLSVVSVVPNLRGMQNGQSPLVAVDHPRSAAAEAFRTLRATLSSLSRAGARRVFLFTSALPGEGKTFCSINYAASLAQLGRKTLLIDGDLRRPCVEVTLMGQENGSLGLSDYLAGQKQFAEVVQPTKVANLFLMSGGTTVANPAELLAGDGLGALVQEALTHYDRVVLDSAPISAVSDTLLMLRSVESVCVVVHAARTSGRHVLRSVQLLQGAEAPLSGIVLNRMPRRGAGSNAYYDYGYHRKYDKEGVYGSR